MSLLGDKVVELHGCLDATGIPHAFGGALALAYCTRPARGTEDIDVNIFLPTQNADLVLGALPREVSVPDGSVQSILQDAQIRLAWGHTPLDLFFSDVEFHDAMATRCRIVPFASISIPVLSCTDLAICKALFARPKDWVDIEAMAETGSLDTFECLDWVDELMGRDDDRVHRLKKIFTETKMLATPPGGDELPSELRSPRTPRTPSPEFPG